MCLCDAQELVCGRSTAIGLSSETALEHPNCKDPSHGHEDARSRSDRSQVCDAASGPHVVLLDIDCIVDALKVWAS